VAAAGRRALVLSRPALERLSCRLVLQPRQAVIPIPLASFLRRRVPGHLGSCDGEAALKIPQR